MLRGFEDWAAGLVEQTSLEALRGMTIGIEAADYISKLLTIPSTKEPLLAALGGVPYSLKHEFEEDLKALKKFDITPIFVFPGLQFGRKDKVFRQTEELAHNSIKAWHLYDHHDPEGAVAQFGEPVVQQRVYNSLIEASDGAQLAPICAEDMFRLMQTILKEAGTQFLVAPYGAWAQLAYMYQQGNIIEYIVGSSEILLFDVDVLITSLILREEEFTFVRKTACLQELGVDPEVFLDACLLSGSPLLPTLPQLETNPLSKTKIKFAISLLNSHGRKGNNVCFAFQEDTHNRNLNYTDKYRRCLLSVKHHIVLTVDGKLEPFKLDDAPGDVHELMSQRLPDEIFAYLSRGLIGPRVLNWRASGEIVETCPLDGGDSEQYQALVRDVLTPIRAITLSVLSKSLARFYQHKDVTLQCWFDRSNVKEIGSTAITDPAAVLNSWCGQLTTFRPGLEGCGPLGYLVRSLENKDYAASTVSQRKPSEQPLDSQISIQFNALGRLLQLRQYVDAKHNLTPWGEALKAGIAALDGREDLEQAVFLAIEMARLGQLSHEFVYHDTSGAPTYGTDKDKRNCLLIARVACAGTLRHRAIGYTGPLNRHLLSYHSSVTVIRKSLHDLAEVCLATLLVNGDAIRDSKNLNFAELGLTLPFATGNNCSLGVATLAFLNEQTGMTDPTSAEAKDLKRPRGPKEWFPTSVDVAEDVQVAFTLWDAVYAGAQAIGSEWKDKQVWDEANTWLKTRR